MSRLEQCMEAAEDTSARHDIVFVIPFISRHAAKDFARSSALLGETLSALRKQKWCSFAIIVVSNDLPECPMDGVVFVQSDVVIVKSDRPGSYHVDKERRVAIGLARAAALAPRYVMCVDADDIVSPFLGWFLKRFERDMVALRTGWIYAPVDRIAYPSLRFYGVCGTSLAFRPDAGPIPPMGYDFGEIGHEALLARYWTVSGHKQDPRRIAETHGLSFGQLYWPLAYYRVWAGSLSSVDRRLSSQDGILGLLKRLLFPLVDARVRNLTR